MEHANINRNLQKIILLNSDKLLSEFYHSPEMYKILIESKTKTRPTDEHILPLIFEQAMMDENFVKRNYHILVKENISTEEQSLIFKDLMENIFIDVLRGVAKNAGRAIDLAGKAIGWVWKTGKWVWEGVGKAPGPPPKTPPKTPTKTPPQIPIVRGRQPWRDFDNPMKGWKTPKHGPGGDGLPFGRPEKPDPKWNGPGWYKQFGGDEPPPPPPGGVV